MKSESFEEFNDELRHFIEQNGRDTKFKIGDEFARFILEGSSTVSYDFLKLSGDFSFGNPEINFAASESISGLSDAQIYFHRAQEVCKMKFDSLLNQSRGIFQKVNMNTKLRNLTEELFTDITQCENLFLRKKKQFVTLCEKTAKQNKQHEITRLNGLVFRLLVE